MAGWGKVVTGAVLGVVGTVYATNEEFRKQLPKAARDLPVTVRRRFSEAVSAAREASSTRREEILKDLDRHGGGAHAGRGIEPDPALDNVDAQSAGMANPQYDPDATRPLPRVDE